LTQNPAPLISPKLDKKLVIPHNTTLQKSLKPTTNHHEHPHDIPQTVLDRRKLNIAKNFLCSCNNQAIKTVVHSS